MSKPIELQSYIKLQECFKQWQQFSSKGQLKMKMKIDKDKKQYYDFDFSRYQYYYNYPDHHYSFLKPNRQRELFEMLVGDVMMTQGKGLKGSRRIVKEENENNTENEQKQHKDREGRQQQHHKRSHSHQHQQTTEPNDKTQASNADGSHKLHSYFSLQQPYTNTLVPFIKPYQLQQFLFDYRQRIRQKITCLRIKKALLTPKRIQTLMSSVQNRPPIFQLIQLVETEIRTYLGKLAKVDEYQYQFGAGIDKRAQEKRSHLKTVNKDEMHFATVDKSDFIIYERLRKNDKIVEFVVRCLGYQVQRVLRLRYSQVERVAYRKALESVTEIVEREKMLYEERKQKIMKYLGEKQPHFLEEFSNLSSIEEFLRSLDYLQSLSSCQAKSTLNINLHYIDLQYIPGTQQQLLTFIRRTCTNHFSPQLLNQLLPPSPQKKNPTPSEQHLCYKLTKLASTIFRITQETYDLTTKQHEKDIMTKRTVMRRELETVFARDLDRLVGVGEHEIVGLVRENSYEMQQLEETTKGKLTEKQLVYDMYFTTYNFIDPFLASFSNLLFARKQPLLHQAITQYLNYLTKRNSIDKKLQHLLLYYQNIHSDLKNHLINVMNQKLSLIDTGNSNPNRRKFLEILSMKRPQEKVSIELLKAGYFLRMVEAIQHKNKLMNVVNGQVNVMLRMKSRLGFLKRKHNLRFQLSKEFLTRYTETNEKQEDPFDFLREVQTADSRVSHQVATDKLFIEDQPQQQKGYAAQSKQNSHKQQSHTYTVYVKRTNPQNPLYQGKKIIYSESLQQTQTLITRLVKLGSRMIQQRQNYLCGQQLTHVVDRVELVYTLVWNEVRYQYAKLRLMNGLLEVLERSVSPEGIREAVGKLYEVKMTQFSLSLGQSNFVMEYQHAIRNLQLKCEVLDRVKAVVQRQEQRITKEVMNGLIRSNLNQHSPQISSIFYTQSAKVQDQIDEEDSDKEEDQLLVGDIQMNPNSNRAHSLQNQCLTIQNINLGSNNNNNILNSSSNNILQSSMFSGSQHTYKRSDYHVKRTFKQILGSNSTNKVKSTVEKKEQMLNRKRKRVLNDSVLGKLLNFRVQNHDRSQQQQQNPPSHHSNRQPPHNPHPFSQYLHLSIQLMNLIQSTFQSTPKYKQLSIQNASLELIIKQLSVFVSRSLSYEPEMKEELLPSALHQCARQLSRVVERGRKDLNGIEHLEGFSQKLVESIIKGTTTSEDVIQCRGLYLSLSWVQLSQMLYQYQLVKHRQSQMQQQLLYIIKQYTPQPKPQLLLCQNLLQSFINPSFKLFCNITKNLQQHHLLLLPQYQIYVKQLLAIDSFMLEYYEHLVVHLIQEHIDRVEAIVTEMGLLLKGCWVGETGGSGVEVLGTKVENKVWLGKKIQGLVQFKKGLIKKETIGEYLKLPIKIITQTITKPYSSITNNYTKSQRNLHNSYHSNTSTSKKQQSLSHPSHQFLTYLKTLNLLMTKLAIVNSVMHKKLQLNHWVRSIDGYVKILPGVSDKIVIGKEEERVWKEVFAEEILLKNNVGKVVMNNSQRGNVNVEGSSQDIFTISLVKLKPSYLINLTNTLNTLPSLSSKSHQLFNTITTRQYLQFKPPQQSLNRHRNISHIFFKQFSIHNPLKPPFNHTLNQITSLYHSTNLQHQLHRIKSLRTFIETRLLLFGLQLGQQERVRFRIMLLQGKDSFNIFWKDETSNLLSTRDFVKLRNFKLQTKQLNQKYKMDYLTFTNLRHKYKNLIEKITQANLDLELQDSIYLVVLSMYFSGVDHKLRSITQKGCHQLEQYKFLSEFGEQFQKPDGVRQFFKSIIREKVFLMSISRNFTLANFIKQLFSQQLTSSLSQFRQFQQRNNSLRFHINSIRRKNQPSVTTEILHFRLQKFILMRILANLSVPTQSHRLQLQVWAKSFRQKVEESHGMAVIMLNDRERRLVQMGPQLLEQKSKLQLLKDQALQSVYYIKYFTNILTNMLYTRSQQVLSQQLQLQQCLGDSFFQRQLNKDNKVITQSLNKVLAPKVMLNPFLNSPLLLQNYFFAGALKLSYIDQFLNRLRNRAIMVQLAQGGFGFLLKVSELDQSVNALCKGVVAFSEKQFHDRLRSYFQYTDQLKQSMLKLKKQNQHLKTTNKLHSFYDQKQIKSLLYQKLHSYLQCITQKQHTYDLLFSMFRTLQVKIMSQCDSKYQQRISQLQKQNQLLRATFQDYIQRMRQTELSSVNEMRDRLYGEFRGKVEKVLNRDVLPSLQEISTQTFAQKQQNQSQVLLRKLKQNSTVNKLKTNLLVAQYQRRIHQLQTTLKQKQQLITQLYNQKQKAQCLKEEVSFLSNKAIEVEALQKQRKLDLQERMMEKFKLIKINESLQGKLARGEQGASEKRREKEKSDKKDERHLEGSQHNTDRELQQVVHMNKSMNNGGRQLLRTQKRQSSLLKSQKSVFLTKVNPQTPGPHHQQSSPHPPQQQTPQNTKKRSHTQFSIQPHSVSSTKPRQKSLFIQSRAKNRLVTPQQQPKLPLHTQYQLSKMQQIDEGRIWREKWQRSEGKFQYLAQRVKRIGENFMMTKNGKKLGEKVVELLTEIGI